MRKFLFNDPRVPEFVARSVGSTDCKAYASFGVEDDGKIVTGVVFDNYTGANVFIHFSTDPTRRIGRSFLKLVFSWAFDWLKVKRITGAFGSGNDKVKRFAEQLGFSYETRLVGAYSDGDMVFYALRRPRCRHLIKSGGPRNG